MFDSYWKEINNKCLLDYDTMKTLYYQLKLCQVLNGSTAEIGVYKGTTSKFIVDILNKPHYCYDTFEGITNSSLQDGDKHSNGDFSCNLNMVKQNINKKNVFYKKGLFPSTFREHDIDFCFVYSDTATCFGARNTYDFFKDRIVSNGKIIFYYDKNCNGVKNAINGFINNSLFDIYETKNLVIFTKK